MKKFKEFRESLDEKVVDVVQRKKMARRMAKMAKSSAFQAKKKRTLMKVRSPAKLAIVAKKKTIDVFRKKFYPNYKDMPIPQKVKVDQKIIQKYGAKIAKIAKKTAMKLKKSEVERVKKAREADKE